MVLQDSTILSNLDVQGSFKTGNGFEKKYIAARIRENRVYDDKEVSGLPEVLTTHQHYAEWQVRKRSSQKLVHYLEAKKQPVSMLEIGCGNGWLSNQLSMIKDVTVTGQDINFTELQQAARVFNDQQRLLFIYGDVFSGILKKRKFDVIVFAASIQYFPSLSRVIALALDHLHKNGEIHILDTHFYQPEETAAAAARTYQHYHALGYPEMADYYFHHSVNDLAVFKHKILFDPHSLINRLRGKRDPFAWVRIKKN